MHTHTWDDRYEGNRHNPATRLSSLAVAAGVGVFLALAAPSPARASSAAGVAPGPEGSNTAVTGGPSVDGAAQPLTDSDRDLLKMVRLAGLWEEPAGRMAAQKGVNRRVREIGTLIADQHEQLDALDLRAAEQVGVTLPEQPTAQQQAWLDEMRAASGAQFDHVFVDRLRASHGKVFPLIANVRAQTKNSVVRQLAQSANNFVLGHLTMLESTGLVDVASLGEPAQASTAAQTTPTVDYTGPSDGSLGNTCDNSRLEPHDGFQKGNRCVSTEFGEVGNAENNPSLLITAAPRTVRANRPFDLRVSTRNLVRDRFLAAAQGSYYKESSFLAPDGSVRGHFHTACRMITSQRDAPDPAPAPAFFGATEDGGGGRTPDTVTVRISGLPRGEAQCAVWAGDGSHRVPMMQRANQIPAFDVIRINVL